VEPPKVPGPAAPPAAAAPGGRGSWLEQARQAAERQQPEAVTERKHLAEAALDLIEVVEGADEAAAGEAVRSFLLSQTYAMFRADSIDALGFDRSTLSYLADIALMPLVPVKRVLTAGERLLGDVDFAVGRRRSGVIRRAIERHLPEGEGEWRPVDRFLDEAYFAYEIDMTGRVPRVWHIRSPNGRFSALVDGRRLGPEQLDILVDRLLGAILADTVHGHEQAVRQGREEEAAVLADAIQELRAFQSELGWLWEGHAPEYRIVYPGRPPSMHPRVWRPEQSEGILPHLAVLQRIGVLAQPVLSDDEMAAFSPL